MKRNTLFALLVLALASCFAAAQAHPSDMGTGQQSGQGAAASPQMSQPGVPTGPADQPGFVKVDDATLQRQVHDQLASQGAFANVQVSVKNSVVTLDGTVPSKEDDKQVKKLVKGMTGVYGVKDHLTVSSASGSAAHTTTGAEATGVMGGSGAAGSMTGSSSTEAQNPTTGANPSERGSIASNGSALGQSPCTCAPSGTAGANLPSTGAANTSTSGTQTSSGSATANTAGGATSAGNQAAQPQPCVCPEANATGTAASSPAAAGGVSGTAAGTSGSIGSQSSAQSGNVGASAGASGAPSAAGQQPSPGGVTSEQNAGQSSSMGQSSGSMGASSAASTDLSGQIQTALKNEPTLSNDSVQVNTTDDTITLTGTVATSKGKQTAHRIAESFAGNRRVVDHITVTGHGQGANQMK